MEIERDPNKKIDAVDFFDSFVALLRKHISPVDGELAYKIFYATIDICEKYNYWAGKATYYAENSF